MARVRRNNTWGREMGRVPRRVQSGRTSLLALWLAWFFAGHLALAQLPPEIMADRYLVQAERELDNGEPGAAVVTLDRILTLQAEYDLKIPDAFWFRRAQASYDAGLYSLAIESAIEYLEIAGQNGEHYVAVLELYDAAELADEQSARLAALQPGDSLSDALISGGRGPEMVMIAPGSFRMGCVSGQDCGDDEVVREVRISQSFMMSKYEVTFEQWDACVDAGGCNGYRPNDQGWGRRNRPVIEVGLEHAQSYVSWLTSETGREYRLPSEAEWEYAARAGSTTKFSWGNDIGFNRANCRGCGSQWDASSSAPAGSFAPNAWGLFDMHGNVWEWVAGGVLRGGSWDNNSARLGSSTRAQSRSGDGTIRVGIRIARTITP